MTNPLSQNDLENRFAYHAPTSVKVVQHEKIRELCKTLASELNDILPCSRETSLAFTELEKVMFWANAAIARNA